MEDTISSAAGGGGHFFPNLIFFGRGYFLVVEKKEKNVYKQLKKILFTSIPVSKCS